MSGDTRRGAAVMALAGAAVTLSLALAGCGGDAKGSEPKATPSCPTTLPAPSSKIAPSTIYLNIINAGNLKGAATKTAKQLGWRGYQVLETKNQGMMDDRPVPKAAEIRYGEGGRQIALTLATQVRGAVLTQDDRTNPTVDLVIGQTFALVPVPPPPASKVEVNIYNTTWRAGLSGQVAEAMRGRDFTVLRNDNDPQRRFLPDDVAIIIAGERGEPAARRVLAQFKGAKYKQDGREDTTVDVVLGNRYNALVPLDQAVPPKPKPTPRPPGC